MNYITEPPKTQQNEFPGVPLGKNLFLMTAVKLVIHILPCNAFLVHKDAYKVKQVCGFPDDFILTFSLADFLCLFLNLFANAFIIKGCSVASRAWICKTFRNG